MKENWERFEGQQFRLRTRPEPRVTLHSRTHTILLNDVAHATMGEPAAVEMFIDGNSRRVALRPCDPQRKNAFRVMTQSNSFKRVSTAAFFQHYRIKFTESILFQDPEFDEDGTMKLDLNKTTRIRRGAR